MKNITPGELEAEAIIRSGVLRDFLPQVIREMEATTIFIEHPVGETCRFDEASWKGSWPHPG